MPEIATKDLGDGRVAAVTTLLYDRARINVGPKRLYGFVWDDGW